jgi:hypothetical protein
LSADVTKFSSNAKDFVLVFENLFTKWNDVIPVLKWHDVIRHVVNFFFESSHRDSTRTEKHR